MKLIIDSGSTKADWALLTATEVRYFSTPGINPSTQQMSYIEGIIRELCEHINSIPKTIIHYGAGCGSEEAKINLKELYHRIFPNSNATIHTDLLGACRSACQGTAGIVCILGTGSHAALSDGHKVTHQLPSLGYILGDEGSATHLARMLLHQFFLKKLNDHDVQFIADHVPELNMDYIFQFYQSPDKVKLLSLIGRFIIDHKNYSWAQGVIHKSFQSFIDSRLDQYKSNSQIPVHAIGSVAYFLQDEFRTCLENNHFRVGEIIRNPIESLTIYHKNHDIN